MNDKMNDNVIRAEFKPRRFERVWECGKCGGQKWYIHEDGNLECVQCGRLSEWPEDKAD